MEDPSFGTAFFPVSLSLSPFTRFLIYPCSASAFFSGTPAAVQTCFVAAAELHRAFFPSRSSMPLFGFHMAGWGPVIFGNLELVGFT